MEKQQLLDLAKAEGFTASMIEPNQIPIDPRFRAFCEENLCGQYNANYACPPDCGGPEELHRKLLSEDIALIVQTVWDIAGYEDKQTVNRAKVAHNTSVLRLMKKLKEEGYEGFCAGYNGCPLCNPCNRKKDIPCSHPDLQVSCMSAFCVDVAALAKQCRLDFAWSQSRLYLFGMIAVHKR